MACQGDYCYGINASIDRKIKRFSSTAAINLTEITCDGENEFSPYLRLDDNSNISMHGNTIIVLLKTNVDNTTF